MNIAVGSDHAGFEGPDPKYKPAIIEHLRKSGHEIIDCGTNSDDAVDYPDIAQRVADEILSGRAEIGVIICGTGIGVSITANRMPGIRAALCCSTEMAELARTHNHANVLCVGKRTCDLETIKAMTDTFVSTPFSDAERHRRRVGKIG